MAENPALKVRELKPGVNLLYGSTHHEILENTNQYYRYILGEANLRLLMIARELSRVRPNARILSTRLDSIYYEDIATHMHGVGNHSIY